MVLWPRAANRASSRGFYFCELDPAFLLIAPAIFLLPREHLRAATFLSLAAWLVLGFFAASIGQQPKPNNYFLNVLNSGELDLQAPLRWRGILPGRTCSLRYRCFPQLRCEHAHFQRDE
jgi:hypothetical protein